MIKNYISVGEVYEDQSEDWVYIDTKENGIYRGQSFGGALGWYDKYGQNLGKGPNLIVEDVSTVSETITGIAVVLIQVAIFFTILAGLFYASWYLSFK